MARTRGHHQSTDSCPLIVKRWHHVRSLWTMHGRTLRKYWGDGPPKFEVGGRPMHPFPQYFEKECYRMRVKVRTE